MEKDKFAYRVTLTEQQFRIVNAALEDYFRTRMGQFDKLAEDIALMDADLSPENPEHKAIFNRVLDNRDHSIRMFDAAYREAKYGDHKTGIMLQPEYCRIAYELHQVLRFELWKANGCVPSYSVAGGPFLTCSDQPMAIVERVLSDGETE